MNLVAWRNSFLKRSSASVLAVAAALYAIQYGLRLPISATLVLGFYLSLIFIALLPLLFIPENVSVAKLFQIFLITVPLRFLLVPLYLIFLLHEKMVALIYFLPACLFVYIVSHLVDIPHYFRLGTSNASE